MAIAHTELANYDQATQHAHQAVHLTPDAPFAWFVLGELELRRHRLDEAMEAAQRSIELDPLSAHGFGLTARIHLLRKDWQTALDRADEGLRLDPEDDECTNVRAMALTKLGRRAEAAASLGAQLARTPEDSRTHANMAWTHLHQGDYAQAETHFREALRLDPSNEWARQGIKEALQARHWFYRPVLRFFLWMGRLRGRAQAAIVIGGVVLYRLALAIASDNNALAPVAWLVVGGYLPFVIATWFAEPLAAGMLSLHSLGRLALTRGERLFARALCLGLAFGVTAIAFGYFNDHDVAMVAGLATLFTCASAVMAERVPAGQPRRALAGLTGVVAILGVWWTVLMFRWETDRDTLLPLLQRAQQVARDDRDLDAKQKLEPNHDPTLQKQRAALQARSAALEADIQQLIEQVGELQSHAEELAARKQFLGGLSSVTALLAVVGSQILAAVMSSRAQRK